MPTLRTRAGKGSELSHNELDANFKRTVTQQTTTYQVLLSDNRSVIEGSHASTPFTITLPPVATADNSETSDFEVTINNINVAVVSVDGSGSETIGGSTNTVDLGQWASVTFRLDSAQTGWVIGGEGRAYPSVVANHIRAGNAQLYFEDGTVTSSGDLINGAPAITENTFETFGPTGSGATNIWATLDDVPASATMLILFVEIQVRANSSGAYNIQFYTMEGDDVGPSMGDSVANQMTAGAYADAATEYILHSAQIIIPVNSAQVFHAGWSGFNQDDVNSSITMNYRGFMTD